MSRRNRTVRAFAQRAGIEPDLALELLTKSAFSLDKPEALIPKNKTHIAEVALGLSSKPVVVRKKPKPVKPVQPPQPKPIAPIREPETEIIPKRSDGIPLVGKRMEMEYLNRMTVEKIHWHLVKDFSTTRDPIAPPGIKNESLLESALTRYVTSLGRDLKYPTLELATAALLHSLIHNHPFHNGNKRTALVSALTFLDLNGSCVNCTEVDLFKFVMNVGAHNLSDLMSDRYFNALDSSDKEVWAIARWIHSHIYRKMAASRIMKFHQLRRILQDYGCRFQTVNKGFINVYRDNHQTQIWYGGEGREVDLNIIQRIRRDLELDEAHGYDTAFFYNAEERLPAFILKYRITLSMLARE